MGRIKLGARPKTFAHTVTVQMPEGGTASVRMQYRYRTRTEFGQFVDDLVRAAGTALALAVVGLMASVVGPWLTGWLSQQALGDMDPWFIAPMGASAVLLFLLPASPLAQPWAILGGNLVSALIGVSCAKLLGHDGADV